MWGFLRPHEYIRVAVEKWHKNLMETKKKLFVLHWRTNDYFGQTRWHYKEEYYDIISELKSFSATNFSSVLQYLNITAKEMNSNALVIGNIETKKTCFFSTTINHMLKLIFISWAAPPEESEDLQSLIDLEYAMQTKRWADKRHHDHVMGDMWLMSLANVLVYNPTSTCSRTGVLWSLLNTPNAILWPTPEMYTHRHNNSELFCKKFGMWRTWNTFFFLVFQNIYPILNERRHIVSAIFSPKLFLVETFKLHENLGEE